LRFHPSQKPQISTQKASRIQLLLVKQLLTSTKLLTTSTAKILKINPKNQAPNTTTGKLTKYLAARNTPKKESRVSSIGQLNLTSLSIFLATLHMKQSEVARK
jgi:hypothetical protein